MTVNMSDRDELYKKLQKSKEQVSFLYGGVGGIIYYIHNFYIYSEVTKLVCHSGTQKPHSVSLLHGLFISLIPPWLSVSFSLFIYFFSTINSAVFLYFE